MKIPLGHCFPNYAPLVPLGTMANSQEYKGIYLTASSCWLFSALPSWIAWWHYDHQGTIANSGGHVMPFSSYWLFWTLLSWILILDTWYLKEYHDYSKFGKHRTLVIKFHLFPSVRGLFERVLANIEYQHLCGPQIEMPITNCMVIVSTPTFITSGRVLPSLFLGEE